MNSFLMIIGVCEWFSTTLTVPNQFAWRSLVTWKILWPTELYFYHNKIWWYANPQCEEGTSYSTAYNPIQWEGMVFIPF